MPIYVLYYHISYCKLQVVKLVRALCIIMWYNLGNIFIRRARGSCMKDTTRVTLFTGHFGSGKTELAINYSIKLSKQGHKVTLVDLDIVNPFFRSNEAKDILNAHGIKVLAPNFADTTLDIPSLPPDIYGVFCDESSKVVFDVGGDEVGATVLGRFYPQFREEPYTMFYVINTLRPLSSNKDDIVDMLMAVQKHSRLNVSYLINNSNLSYETDINHILDGQCIVEDVSRETNIPIAFVSARKDLLGKLPDMHRTGIFSLDKLYMQPPWI
jgi:hypothetical protein